ncbi:activating signal cointegrator 1 complex subunit 2 isoform X2 [Selaginella moellendorffii]|uniref:activating signal cointegrator 1 complex subunit 2 isoform X2 n=1 Tax=Selaginella moellendorffii TaxID=88036 RepID=UPI000D1CBC0F|nr:activating signal cointegrator 1 complex subunit 2 isoform X2 [Selaginella moellendorffii]|eukprot:XP_024526999.1 activating signal cointegrator 1 complex subunit 2 isoform X2 [Selaginella moellendorffii]
MAQRRQYQARNSPAMEWKARDPATRPSDLSENGRYCKPGLVFVAYLPQDEANSSQALEIIDFLNAELSRLLRMKAREFWEEVTANESLHEFLESYLLYRRRWYDLHPTGGVVPGEDDLSRRVFMVLLRMCSDEDPGLSRISAAKFRVEDKFNVAKLLNVCAIYGHDNPELTRRLVSTVLKFQPSYLQTLSDVARQVLATIDGVNKRTLESIGHSTNKSNSEFKDELMEAVVLLHDTVMTLNAFVEIYPPAAGFFLSAEPADKSLMFSLSCVYNSLLPSVRKQSIGEELSRYLDTLQRELVHFAWSLLFNSFFGDTTTRMDSKANGEVFVDALIGLSFGSDGASLIHSLSNMFDLSGNVHRLLQEGSIVLDDGQYAQLLALLPDMPSTNFVEDRKPPVSVSHEKDEEDAIRQSHISQIKDLLPDYDDAFLSACLEVYDSNPEIVIQHILEGTIHPDLTSTPKKGKGKLVDSKKEDRSNVDAKGKGKAVENQASKAQGRFVRKRQNRDDDAATILDERDAGTSNQTAKLAMQLMYEDEYDDSFDDLDTNVAEAGLETDSLVNLFSRTKLSSDSLEDGQKAKPFSASQKQEPSGRPQRKQEASRFFVKDGKHYNYKVAGAVAVSSLEEAEALKKQEEGLIYGLGRGGNVPANSDGEDDKEEDDGGEDDKETAKGTSAATQHRAHGERGKPPYRPQFATKKNHNKKDLSLKKHMSGLRGS